MREEALQAAEVCARQMAADGARVAALASALREAPPTALLTIARGSSDHAAAYMAYLVMARLGRPVTSLPMSLVTLYQSPLQGRGVAAFAFSQSGRSPDLVAPTRLLREGGARTVALVNDADSPLAQAAEWVLPLHAGPERSVAATKSYIAQLVAGGRLVAAWQQDDHLLAALHQLPEVLRRAAALDWSPAVEALRGAERLYVIGRGTGLPIAQEAALKFKETCGLHAEAYSSAEVQHGPMALVGPGFPMLVLAPRGPAQAGVLEMAQAMRARGARVLLAAPDGTPGADLPLATTGDADLDPLAAIQSFYPMVEALARARGLDPDQPPHLAKVTCTH
jgi:glucosamine--fructose-6-phosphate aminotransferase (isomerizing)